MLMLHFIAFQSSQINAKMIIVILKTRKTGSNFDIAKFKITFFKPLKVEKVTSQPF